MTETYPFNLNHLRYFYEVARAGNMRRASARIGVSQPALSKQIQALEDAMGLQLFYRSSKGLTPTPDGDIVMSHCVRLFGHLRDLEEAVEGLRTGSAGRVTIGAIYSIGIHILPPLIRQYYLRFPKVRFRVVSMRSAGVLEALREHRADVGFVAGRPEDSERLTATPFDEGPLVPVAAPEHPLVHAAAAEGRLAPGQLERQDMVAFDEEAPTRRLTDSYLDVLDVAPRIMAQSPNIETIKRLVREGVGFAVLPRHAISEEVERGALVALPIEAWALRRTLYIVHLAHPPLPPTVRHFIELIPSISGD